MALIRPILGELSGHIAGNTFSRNKGGLYVKRTAHPTNPNTARQQELRTLLSHGSGSWSAMAPTVRQAWRDYAANNPRINRLGETFNLTGHQMFVALRSAAVDAGFPAFTDPPVELAPAPLLTLSATAPGGTDGLVLTWTAASPPAGRLKVWQAAPHSAGSMPNLRQCKLAGYSAAAPTSPTNITAPTAYVAGMSYTVYVAVISDEGLESPPLRATFTSAAP